MLKGSNKNLRRRGFSLVELMVAVSLVGVLSATAIPNVVKYISDAKNSEAAIILADAGKDQERIFTITGSYTDVLKTDDSSRTALMTRFPKSRFNLIVGGGTRTPAPTEITRFDQLNDNLPTSQNADVFGAYESDYSMAVEGNTDGDPHMTMIAMNKKRALITVCDDYGDLKVDSAFEAFWSTTSGISGGGGGGTAGSAPSFSCEVPDGPSGFSGGPG